MMHRVRVVLIAVVVALTLIVVLQNMETAETDILFFTISMPRAFLLALTALGGFVVGVLVALRKPR
jgi:uncharacterized integral membrane protein